MGLLHSLGDERKRWEASSETFKSQMATIVGDVLLSSAFMAYAGMIGFYLDYIIYGVMCCRLLVIGNHFVCYLGYYDQPIRQNLFSTWTSHLLQANIQFKHDLSTIEVSDAYMTAMLLNLSEPV